MSTWTNCNAIGPARRFAASAVSILTGMVMVAGCGDGDQTAATSSATVTPSTSVAAPGITAPAVIPSTDKVLPVGPTWLTTAEAGNLGTILAGDSGRTVYAFSKDTPNESTCYDACADTWLPHLDSGGPAGGIGIDVARAGTTTRRDGHRQTTYAGHPLYYYAGDTTPGQTKGQGLDLFGGQWYILTPDGDRVG